MSKCLQISNQLIFNQQSAISNYNFFNSFWVKPGEKLCKDDFFQIISFIFTELFPFVQFFRKDKNYFNFFLILQQYLKGQTCELPKSTILQMMGRAGRQQYCSSGKVIILTKLDKKVNIENILFSPKLIEF